MGDSLQMAEKRALWARWTPRTNGHHPPSAPETEQKIADLTRRIETLEALANSLSPLTIIHRRPNMPQIVKAVCAAYRVSETDLLSQRRPQPLVRYRQVAMYLCSELSLNGSQTVGQFFQRDHTSVLGAHKKIAALRCTDAELCAQLAALEANLFPEGIT